MVKDAVEVLSRSNTGEKTETVEDEAVCLKNR